MAWTNTLPLTDLLDREATQFEINGRQIMFCRDGDDIYALDNQCPHAGAPLAMGNFNRSVITCPWHAWAFDCRTGECVHSPSHRVANYPVEVRDGQVWIDLPESE
jgi:nitrite reductase/ring-hydroxylating ferredoxin subunit